VGRGKGEVRGQMTEVSKFMINNLTKRSRIMKRVFITMVMIVMALVVVSSIVVAGEKIKLTNNQLDIINSNQTISKVISGVTDPAARMQIYNAIVKVTKSNQLEVIQKNKADTIKQFQAAKDKAEKDKIEADYATLMTKDSGIEIEKLTVKNSQVKDISAADMLSVNWLFEFVE
jgi:hypothetical protein